RGKTSRLESAGRAAARPAGRASEGRRPFTRAVPDSPEPGRARAGRPRLRAPLKFHVLHLVVGSDAETQYESGAPLLGDSPRRPSCGAFVGPKAWQPPYRARLSAHGSRVGDVAFGAGSDLLISRAFLHEWEERGVTGLGPIDPVEILGELPESLSGR